MWHGDNNQPHAVTTRLGSGLIYSLSHGSSPGVRLHWLSCLAAVGPLTEFFLCSISSWMPISVFISDWSRWALSLVLLCGACYVILALALQYWIVGWACRHGQWSEEDEREGEKAGERGWTYEKNSEWISVPSLFIGWWRATLCVYPWPSYLLISPPF